jgi:cobalt-zinc-cadmium efflux system protein
MGLGHDHAHGPTDVHDDASARLRVAFFLNLGFTIFELAGAWWTNSTAIAADAIHDLGDSLSLAFAWGVEGISRRGATDTYTYGFRRLSLAGALVNALVLVVGGVVVLTRSIPRLADPQTPDAQGMVVLALIGVVVNGVAAFRMRAGRSLNEKVVSWHLIEDIMGWVAVLIVSVVMVFVDLPILDPILSIVITLWIAFNAARHLRKTLLLFFQAVPEDIEPERLREHVRSLPQVLDLRHVHVWSHEGENHVLTGELHIVDMSLSEALNLRERVRKMLEDAGVAHVTLELSTHESGKDDCKPS